VAAHKPPRRFGQAAVLLSISRDSDLRTLARSLCLPARFRGHIPEGTLFRPPTLYPFLEKGGEKGWGLAPRLHQVDEVAAGVFE
jgi:hypothetical protein